MGVVFIPVSITESVSPTYDTVGIVPFVGERPFRGVENSYQTAASVVAELLDRQPGVGPIHQTESGNPRTDDGGNSVYRDCVGRVLDGSRGSSVVAQDVDAITVAIGDRGQVSNLPELGDVRAVLVDGDAGLASATGMAGDVGQGFLDHPVHRGGDHRRPGRRRGGQPEIDGRAVLFETADQVDQLLRSRGDRPPCRGAGRSPIAWRPWRRCPSVRCPPARRQGGRAACGA